MLAEHIKQPRIPVQDQFNRNPNLWGLTAIDKPNLSERQELANMIDSNGHAPLPVDREVLNNAPYVLVLKDDREKIVAGACIKSINAGAAEFGFSIVDFKYRRMGLAYWMTQCRLVRAKQMGLSLVYSMVRDSNEASRNNLKKSGFRHAGRYLHRGDVKTRLDWYTMAIKPMSRSQRNKLVRMIISDRVAVIY